MTIERALRITKDGDHIIVQALITTRFKIFGFGTFLENITPGEISITRGALRALLRCKYRSGLQGMEVFAGNALAWGARTFQLKIPLENVSVHKGEAKAWLEACCIVEARLP